MGLSAELLAERLEEARSTYKLNLGYAFAVCTAASRAVSP